MEYEKKDEVTGEIKRYEISYSQIIERNLLWASVFNTIVLTLILFVFIYFLYRLDDMNIFTRLLNALEALQCSTR